MRKLNKKRLMILALLAGILIGIGFFMRNLESDVWGLVTLLMYGLGLIFLALMVWGIMVPPKKKRAVNLANEIDDEKAKIFIEALGGKTNIGKIEACMSRVRVNVLDMEQINQNRFEDLKTAGIFVSGEQIQVIFGEESAVLKAQMDEILSK